MADYAVTGPHSMGGSPWEADNQIAFYLELTRYTGFFHGAISLEHCIGIAGLVGGQDAVRKGVVPGLLCAPQAVPPAAQPLLPGSGQELTEIHRKLILQPNPSGRAWSKLHTAFNTPFQVLSLCVHLL